MAAAETALLHNRRLEQRDLIAVYSGNDRVTTFASALDSAKKEGLICLDWTTQTSAKLLSVEGRFYDVVRIGEQARVNPKNEITL